MATAREEVYGDCPVAAALDVIGGKWKPLVLHMLLARTWRFNEMQRRLHGVTQRVLAAQLRDLEACGLVRREAFAEVPPRVEYSLTEAGRTLRPVIEALAAWGVAHGRGLRKAAAPGA